MSDAAPAAFALKEGKRIWLTRDAVHREIETVDGRRLKASAFSSFDMVSVQAAMGAQNIRFDLVTAESSSRRCGGKAATEIMVEIHGDTGGQASHVRTTLVFEGQRGTHRCKRGAAAGDAFGVEREKACNARTIYAGVAP